MLLRFVVGYRYRYRYSYLWCLLTLVSATSASASASASAAGAATTVTTTTATAIATTAIATTATAAATATATRTDRNLAVYALYNAPPFAVTFRTQSTDELEAALANGIFNNGDTLISESDGGLDSSLSFPLRTITQDFLLERFGLQIQDFRMDKNNRDDNDAADSSTSSTSDFEWFALYDHMVAVDLSTKLYVVETTAASSSQEDKEEESLRTRTRTRARGRGRGRGRSLQSNGSNTSPSSKLTLRAELYPAVAFQEPADSSTKPSNQNVRDLFGLWLQDTFENHRDGYLRELVQSDQTLLREISSLEIETNWDENSASSNNNPSNFSSGWSERTEKALLTMLILLGLMGMGWMMLYLRQRRKHRVLYGHDDEEEEVDYGNNDDNEVRSLSMDRPLRVERAMSMDAVRHGADTFHRSSTTAASSILESTDRYLSKHRPDLYSDSQIYNNDANNTNTATVFGRNYVIPANPFEYIYSAFASENVSSVPSNSNSNGNQPLSPQERYEFATSPGGAFSSPHKSRGSALSRRSSIVDQRENIAASSELAPFDEEVNRRRQEKDDEDEEEDPIMMGGRHWTAGGGYRPISSIWRGISNMMWEEDPHRNNHNRGNHNDHGNHNHHHPNGNPNRAPRAADGVVMYSTSEDTSTNSYNANANANNNHVEMVDVPLHQHQHQHQHPYSDQEYHNSQQQYYHDEQQQQHQNHDYDFAFQDFPRHDGTPCLMFNEAAWQQKEQQRIFTIGNVGNEDENEDDNDNVSDNDDDDYNDNGDGNSNDIEQDGELAKQRPVSDAVFARMLSQHSLNCSFEDTNFSSPDALPASQSPEFKDKLTRLVQQKHRQYEKKAIVEKHREQRAKERKDTREQERRDRHRAMEQDIEEIEASFSSSTPIERIRYSPKPNRHYSPSSSPSPSPSRRQTATHSPKPSRQHEQQQPSRSQYSPKIHQKYQHAFSPFKTNNNNSSLSPRPPPRSPKRRVEGIGRSQSYDHQVDMAAEPSYRTSGHSPYRHSNSNNNRNRNKDDSGTGIFRPSPKTSYSSSSNNHNTHAVHANTSSNSHSSGGGEDYKMRPRTNNSPSQHNNNADLYVDTHGAYNTGARDMDYRTLDKLSMPPMMMPPLPTTAGGSGSSSSLSGVGTLASKHPSPQSVMDELLKSSANASSSSSRGNKKSKPPASSKAPHSHRRVNSYDAKVMMGQQRHPHGPQTTISGIGGGSSSSSSLPPWQQPQQQYHSQNNHQRTQSKGNSNSSTHNGGGGGGGGNHHRRSQSGTPAVGASNHQRSNSSLSNRSRSNSHSDDIFVHGIVAQTRFV